MTESPTLDLIVSPRMLEAANGVFTCAVIIVVAEIILYLWRAYSLWQRTHPSEEVFADFRSRQKPVIALGVLFTGIGVRSGVLWMLRHAENTGGPLPFWHPISSHLIALGTLVAVVGALCWLRVTLSHRVSGFLWPILVGVCFAFPIWLAS